MNNLSVLLALSVDKLVHTFTFRELIDALPMILYHLTFLNQCIMMTHRILLIVATEHIAELLNQISNGSGSGQGCGGHVGVSFG